jgi:hypothetical protein
MSVILTVTTGTQKIVVISTVAKLNVNKQSAVDLTLLQQSCLLYATVNLTSFSLTRMATAVSEMVLHTTIVETAVDDCISPLTSLSAVDNSRSVDDK